MQIRTNPIALSIVFIIFFMILFLQIVYKQSVCGFLSCQMFIFVFFIIAPIPYLRVITRHRCAYTL